MLRCKHCGSYMPTLGNICPHCRTPRDDLDVQERALGGALGGGIAAVITLLVALGFNGWQIGGPDVIGSQLGAVLGVGLVGLVVGMIFPRLAGQLFAVGVLVGIVFAVVWVVRAVNYTAPPSNPPAQSATPGAPVVADVRGKLRVGMTFDEVRGILGEPPPGKAEVFNPLPDGTQHAIWEYPTVRILFMNGKATSVEWTR